MKKKVQGVEIGQLESLHLAETNSLKVIPNPVACKVLNQYGIVRRLSRDDPDVRSIAFVTRTGMSNLYECDVHEAPHDL
jgi:hypothetical protein